MLPLRHRHDLEQNLIGSAFFSTPVLHLTSLVSLNLPQADCVYICMQYVANEAFLVL